MATKEILCFIIAYINPFVYIVNHVSFWLTYLRDIPVTKLSPYFILLKGCINSRHSIDVL